MSIRDVHRTPRTFTRNALTFLGLALLATFSATRASMAQINAEFFRIEGHLKFTQNRVTLPGTAWEHDPLTSPELCIPIAQCPLPSPLPSPTVCAELGILPNGEGHFQRAWVTFDPGSPLPSVQLGDNMMNASSGPPFFYPMDLRGTDPVYFVPVEKTKADEADGLADGNVPSLTVQSYFVSDDGWADTYYPSPVETDAFTLASLQSCFTTNSAEIKCHVQDFEECAGVVLIEYVREASCACKCRGTGGSVILPGDPNYPTGTVTAWLPRPPNSPQLLAVSNVRNTEFTRFPVQACVGPNCTPYRECGGGDSQVVTLKLSLQQGSDLFADVWKTERRVDVRIGCDRVTVVQIALPCPVALPNPLPPTCEPDPNCPPCDDCPPCEGDCPPGPNGDFGFWQVIGAEPEVVYNQDYGTLPKRNWNIPSVAMTSGPAGNERWARVLPQRSQAPPASPYKYSPTGDLSKFRHENIPPSSWPSLAKLDGHDDSRYRAFSTFLLTKTSEPRDASPCTAGVIEPTDPLDPTLQPDALTDDDCLTGVPCGPGPGVPPCDLVGYGITPLTQSPPPRQFLINNQYTTPEALWQSCIGAPVNEPIAVRDDLDGDWINVDEPSEIIVRCATISGATCVDTTDLKPPLIAAPEDLHPWVMKPGAIYGRITFKDKNLDLVDRIFTDGWVLDPSQITPQTPEPWSIPSWIRAGGDDSLDSSGCENWTASPNFSEYRSSLRPDGDGPDGARLFQYRLLAPNLSFLNGWVTRNRMRVQFGEPTGACPPNLQDFYLDGQIYLNPTYHPSGPKAALAAAKEKIPAGTVTNRDEQACFALYKVDIRSVNEDLNTSPSWRPKVRGETADSSYPLEADTPEAVVGPDPFKGAFYGCVFPDPDPPNPLNRDKPRRAVIEVALPTDWDDSKPPVYTLRPALTLAGQSGETLVPEFETCPVECGKCYLRRVCGDDIGPHCSIVQQPPVPTASCCERPGGFSIEACVSDCNGKEVDVTVCSDDPTIIGDPMFCGDALDLICKAALTNNYCAVTDCPQVVLLNDPSSCTSDPGCTPITVCVPLDLTCETKNFKLVVKDRVVPPNCFTDPQLVPRYTSCPFSACSVQPPVIAGCADVTIQCDAPMPPNPTATGPCPTTLTHVDVESGNCPKLITQTWTATDTCGNTASCVRTITVRDTTPPVITCPTNLTLDCPASTDPSVTGTATATDNCSVPTVTHSDAATLTCPQVITRTWKATDACLNTATCVQTITVRDITPPVITCPADVTLDCPANTDPSVTGVPTASDTCSVPAVTHTDAATGSCPQVITRTWKATDACLNTATCVQTITVRDITPPVITCPADVTLDCPANTDPSVTGVPTASDTCSVPAVTHTDAATGSCPQVITRTWKATDACLNTATCVQTITVRDITPPVITCPANVTLDCPANTDPSVTGVPTASDTCSVPAVTHTDAATGSCPQVITRTWKATDACLNTATCVQTITVRDITPPVITCPTDVTLDCPANTDPSVTGVPTASDTCSVPTVTHSDAATGTCPQVITRTWKATDACLNTATCVQTITVRDITPPVITCPPNGTMPCPPNRNYPCPALPPPTVTDDCDPNPTVTCVWSVYACCIFKLQRTCTAVDYCGNTSQCTTILQGTNGCCKDPQSCGPCTP